MSKHIISRTSMCQKIIILFLISFKLCFSQHDSFQILEDKDLEVIFSKDRSSIRFKDSDKKYLNGQKKIINVDDSRSIVSFIDGYPNGKWIIEDKNGIVICISNYENGKKEGKDIYYYANGNIKLIANYANGIQEGKQEMYYYSGVYGGEFFCKNGVKHGVETWYKEISGKVFKTSYFINGKEVDSLKYKNILE